MKKVKYLIPLLREEVDGYLLIDNSGKSHNSLIFVPIIPGLTSIPFFACVQKEKSNKYYTDSGSHVNVPDKNLGPKMLTIFERFLSK